MIQSGFKPKRTIYFTFGHDEETGGMEGAAKVAETLKSRGVKLEVIVDEGGIIIQEGLRHVTNKTIAMVGTSEKVNHRERQRSVNAVQVNLCGTSELMQKTGVTGVHNGRGGADFLRRPLGDASDRRIRHCHPDEQGYQGLRDEV